jgi:CelD/BcsL family acetyltransferase involved in cellulose biosynthesis
MRFSLLDQIQCSCGREEWRVDGLVTTRTGGLDVETMECQTWCGFKQRPVAEMNPADCCECRQNRVVQGRLHCQCGRNWQIVDGIPGFSTALLAGKTVPQIRVVETDPAADPRWERFVARHPQGSIYHHPRWLQTLQIEYPSKPFHLACEDSDGRLLAILPMFHTRGLPVGSRHVTGRRLSSLPRTPLAGPLSIEAQATSAIIQAAMDLANSEPATQVQLKTQSAEFDGMARGLACVPWRLSYILDLSGDPDRPRCSTSAQRHRVKNAVNKAAKAGLSVRVADSENELRAWYQLYLDTMRRNIVPPRPYRFFAALWNLLRPAGLMQLLLAERQELGRPRMVAGSVLLASARTASYVFTGSKREDLVLHPNDLIQWYAIHDAAKKGLHWYDFGEVSEDHQQLTLFKSKWGAEPVQMYRYYYPAPHVAAAPSHPGGGPLKQLARAGWRRLPLPATARLGDWIYSYL